MNYLVRQYRPGFVSGFESSVIKDVPYDEIESLPFLDSFKIEGFSHFTKHQRGGDELIIVAYYQDGSRFVAGFASPKGEIA